MRFHPSKKNYPKLIIIVLFLMFGACGKSKFSAGTKEPGEDAKPNSEAVSPTKEDPKHFEEFEQDCVKNPQKILIMDFKSGWWAGDGGEFFQTMLNGLADACKNTATLEYHHIMDNAGILNSKSSHTMMTFPNFTGEVKKSYTFSSGAFVEQDWNNYTQIWLLSGSHADGMDIKTTNAFFVEVLQHIKSSKANVFIGSGFGSITHSNALGNTLGLGNLIGTNLTEGQILNPGSGVQIDSTLALNDKLKVHNVLTNNVTQIADNLKVAGVSAKGDYITDASKLEIIATNTEGKPTIGVGKIENRQVFVDAGVQRYYAIEKSVSPDTLRFIQNVIIFLSAKN
jgi:hypothetical protein